MWGQDDESGAKFHLGIALFFASFVLVVGIVLMNVVIACLLDKFITTMADEKEEAARLEKEEEESHESKPSGPFDPLMRQLLTYTSPEDLDRKLREITDKIDIDGDDHLTYSELNRGLRSLNLHLSRGNRSSHVCTT
jgi:hypothetical protein